MDEKTIDNKIDIAKVLQSNATSSDNRAHSAAPNARRRKTLDYVHDSENTIKHADKPLSISNDMSDYGAANTKTVTNLKANKTATCNQLKAKSNLKICLKNYTIKSKYQDQMQNFFAGRNFELITPYEHMANPVATFLSKSSNFSGVTGKASDKIKQAPPQPTKKAPVKKESVIAPLEKAVVEKVEKVVNPFFIVPAEENLEKDKNDLREQTLSSWAYQGGLPAKSGVILEHTMKILNNEIE